MPSEALALLLSSGEYSDFTIECRGQTFKVHKNIVCTQSPVIKAALHGEFEEAKANRVKLEFEPEIVQRMLNFMYGLPLDDSAPKPQNVDSEIAHDDTQTDVFKSDATDSGDGLFSNPAKETTKDTAGDSDEGKDELILNAWTNAIGDYCQVPKLCQAANKEISRILKKAWSPAAFLVVVQFAASSTGDKALHHLLTQLAVEHIEDLVKYDSSFPALTSLNNFAVVYMKGSANRVATLKSQMGTNKYQCTAQETVNKEYLNQLTESRAKLAKCLTLIEDTCHCRHCSVALKCTFGSDGTLRCKACKTRH